MKKTFIIAAITLLASCSEKKKSEQIITKTDSVSSETKVIKNTSKKTSTFLVGIRIEGDFDGNGKNEFATVVLTKKGEGNPVEDGTPDEYAISFSDSSLKPIVIGCCDSYLINEGDLNNDRKDDFSVFQAPMNGCTYTMNTYSLKDSNWKQIIEPFSVPTACESFTPDDLQQRIFLENKSVYMLGVDPNDEESKLFKKKIELK